MISTGICDDEEESREKLRRFCREFFGPDSELREYASGEEFLKTLENNKALERGKAPDILLLDIEMAGPDGIEVKRKLIKAETGTRIVFVTSHDEWMADAYGKNVFGFLTKPLRYEKFEEKMWEVAEDVERGKRKVEFIMNQYERKELFLAQILYLKAAKPYTEVWFRERGEVRRKVDENGIQTWKERLWQSDFFMLDKSNLVNLEHVQKVRGEDVLMDDGTELKVSRRKKTEFWREYKRYVDEHAR